MVIARITREDVVADCRETLGLPPGRGRPLDNQLLAGLLRRSAGIHCPCSRATLRASILDSLQHLSGKVDSLPERIDAVIESLIVGGDLLELNDVTTEDTAVRGTWVFAAPPSFVVRPSGGAFLFGIVPDQDAFVPTSLGERVVHEGFTRAIVPHPDEDLAKELRDHELQELSENAWLKSPKKSSARGMIEQFEKRLAAKSNIGGVDDLQILDSGRSVTYYRGRWTVPTNQSGVFVARRPQEFGAPIWCLVRLDGGKPLNLLDLPLKDSRWRGCDVAWHLQMAMDFCRHDPQRYRRRVERGRIRLDFFSPLPQWSQRRLMIFGQVVPRKHSLMSFHLPPAEEQTEEQFLKERLWLSRSKDSE